jgi:hypothetical protein
MTATNPAFSGRPVILVHLEDPAGSGLTTCSGQPFHDSDCFPQIPRVVCELCQARSLGLVARPPDIGRIDLVELRPGDIIVASVPADTNLATMDRVRRSLQTQFGGSHRVVMRTDTIGIEVHRPTDDEAPDADAERFAGDEETNASAEYRQRYGDRG